MCVAVRKVFSSSVQDKWKKRKRRKKRGGKRSKNKVMISHCAFFLLGVFFPSTQRCLDKVLDILCMSELLTNCLPNSSLLLHSDKEERRGKKKGRGRRRKWQSFCSIWPFVLICQQQQQKKSIGWKSQIFFSFFPLPVSTYEMFHKNDRNFLLFSFYLCDFFQTRRRRWRRKRKHRIVRQMLLFSCSFHHFLLLMCVCVLSSFLFCLFSFP